jgi:integrase
MRSGKMYPDSLHYDHLWPSMQRFAQFLALRYDSLRTRHSYYRQLRLLCEHFGCADPALLTEDQLRAYLLHVKTVRLWKPKTMRQALATAHAFFSEMLDLGRWRVFDEVKTKDPDSLPPVLTREQVRALLQSIRLRRYRTPLKLIYCCGLRLSECLNLTIHDILGSESKLRIRAGKGGKDRVIPLPAAMLRDLSPHPPQRAAGDAAHGRTVRRPAAITAPPSSRENAHSHRGTASIHSRLSEHQSRAHWRAAPRPVGIAELPDRRDGRPCARL